MDWTWLDRRPLIVALAGSNGAGKTTFFHTHLADSGLRFVNADDIAKNLDLGAYEAAKFADGIRRALVAKQESFIFETVFSDPVGDKVTFLEEAVEAGYQVALIFIRLTDVETSRQRVSMRAAQGGHDVPDEKLDARFERTKQNLRLAIERLPRVIVFDNSDLGRSYRLESVYVDGEIEKS
jgi:predicted ABC-type ATPase